MKVIFCVLHHKRSLFFEEGIKLLLKDGYKIIIQNTGLDKGFGNFGIKHENLEFINYGDQVSYDTGLVRFKDILAIKDWAIVHFLDNDFFLKDTKYINKTLNDFIKSDFGFCSYLENGDDDTKYEYHGTLAEVTNQQFIPEDPYPFFKPKPHYENAAMMFKRKTWEKIDISHLSHGRKYIKLLSENGIKIGIKKRESRWTYSHFGDGWFHVGNLMAYYYLLEKFDLDNLNPNSNIDLSRIGYFIAQRNKFGKEIYSPEINKNLEILSKFLGGEEKCLKKWQELVKGTCYE